MTGPSGSGGSGRRATKFKRTKQFDKGVSKLDTVHQAIVLNAANKFEQEWMKSATDEDISPGFQLKQLEAKAGQFRLLQIYAGKDYRLALTLVIGKGSAFWVHSWKKTRQRNSAEIETAKARAQSLLRSLS
jgi:hypothetical protein